MTVKYDILSLVIKNPLITLIIFTTLCKFFLKHSLGSKHPVKVGYLLKAIRNDRRAQGAKTSLAKDINKSAKLTASIQFIVKLCVF